MQNKMRKLGASGEMVFPIALGCMGMSGMYGPTEERESLATIQMAIESGVNVLDTGDFYGMGHNEHLIAKAIQSQRNKVLLSVKFGALRGPDGAWLGFDSRPTAVKSSLAYSLNRLGVDCIDIYRPARLDPKVPIEETMGALSECVKAGYIRYIGLSEVGPETIRRAHAIHPIVDLQIEYSILSRSPEAAILPLLNELGISVTAYGILSRGLISQSRPAASGDNRAYLPRFRGENKSQNEKLIAKLKSLADGKGVTTSQLAIAWALAKGENIIATIGSRNRTQLKEALGALQIQLTTQEIQEIETQVPAGEVAGTRYDEHQMKALDSEKR
jgi:aryl-alcohol dehydrogenase-like predicted oxidoreductase